MLDCIHCDHGFGETIPVLEPVKESGCSSNFSIIFISLLTAMPIVLFRRKRFL